MANATPKKITPAAATKPAKENADGAAEKPGRDSFIDGLSTAGKAAMLNAEGKITTIPTVFLGSVDETPADAFNPRKYAGLKRGEFQDEPVALSFKAALLRARAEDMLARAEEAEKAAEDARKFGDPATRKAMKQRDRLMKQLAAIDKKLADEGIAVEGE